MLPPCGTSQVTIESEADTLSSSSSPDLSASAPASQSPSAGKNFFSSAAYDANRNAKQNPYPRSADGQRLTMVSDFTSLLSYLEVDSNGLEPDNADNLCPFCDEPWPDAPSGKLRTLKAALIPHAFSSPRLTNPHGLSAESFTFFIGLCTQHRNETTIIPEGLKQGWPREIDFDALPHRLTLVRAQLAAIIHDPTGSLFYQDAIKELRDLGSLYASSVQGQYLTFDRSRPGYYGERGYVRMMKTIVDLFPDLTSELYNNELSRFPDIITFVSRVLVPETARLLIKNDLNVSDEEAMDVLFKSQAFGMALHPEEEPCSEGSV